MDFCKKCLYQEECDTQIIYAWGRRRVGLYNGHLTQFLNRHTWLAFFHQHSTGRRNMSKKLCTLHSNLFTQLLKIFEKVLFSSFKKSPLQSINKKWRSNKLQNMNEFFQTNYWIRSSCNISSCIIADSCIQFILKKMQYVATPTPSPAPPAWCPDFQLWTARVAVSRHLRSFGKNKSHFISLLPLIFDSIHIKY